MRGAALFAALYLSSCERQMTADYFVPASFNGPVVVVRVRDKSIATPDNHIPAAGLLVQLGPQFRQAAIRVYRSTVPPVEISPLEIFGFNEGTSHCEYAGIYFYVGMEPRDYQLNEMHRLARTASGAVCR